MNPIRLPRAAVQLAAAAAPGDPVRIEQQHGEAVLTVAADQRVRPCAGGQLTASIGVTE